MSSTKLRNTLNIFEMIPNAIVKDDIRDWVKERSSGSRPCELLYLNNYVQVPSNWLKIEVLRMGERGESTVTCRKGAVLNPVPVTQKGFYL